MIDYCSEGLRLEWVCACLLLTLWVLVIPKKPFTFFHGLLGGITIAFASLLRLTLLYPLIVFAILIIIFRRLPLRSAILLVLFSLMPILPHLKNNYKQDGLKDPFYSINIHARYYRNQEFAGKPGFITREEYSKRAYAGTPITAFQYIFQMHDFQTVLNYSWEGFKRIFFTFYMKGRFAPFFVFRYLFWLGAVLLLMRSWGRWIIILEFLSIGGVLFLAGRPAPLFLDYRLVIHIFPFVALSIGGGLSIAIQELKKSVRLFTVNNSSKGEGNKSRKKKKK